MNPQYVCILLFVLFGFVLSDISKDKEKCGNQLVGLATCLPYVGGDAKAPTLDCCTGLKQVLHTNPECICILVKDRNDPSLGLKINATLALSLPAQCHAPAKISDCPTLLHLTPNSSEAKVFEDFANSGKKSNSVASNSAQVRGDSSGKGTSADQKSNGGKRRSLGFLLTIMLFIVPNL